MATLVCIALYACNLTGFTESYFYRAPLTGYDDFPKRVLVKYLQFASARHLPVDVNTATSNDLFQKYMLYANLITRENIPALRTDIIAMSTQFNTIRFLQCADSNKNTPGYTVITDTECGKPVSDHHQSIARLSDGGENYIIEQDFVCNKYNLKRYPDHITLQNLNIDHLSEKDFCEIYISQR